MALKTVVTSRLPVVSLGGFRQVLYRAPILQRNSMSCFATKAVSKGQEQFVEDSSKFQALQGVKVGCVCSNSGLLGPKCECRAHMHAGLACFRAKGGRCY